MAYIGKRPQDTFPATNAITTTTIADNAVTSVKIAENSITTRELAANTIATGNIADNSIDSTKIASNSILTRHIDDNQITTDQIAANTIATANIADNAVDGTKIAQNSILTRHIDDSQVTADQIADDAVTLAKMDGLARGKVIYGDSSGNPAALALGTSGYVLKSDGTDIAWAADAGLSTEEVQDIAGGMFTGNTETGITATYQDGDGTVDLVVGTLNQDTTGLAATATALATARTIGGTSFDGTANIVPGTSTALATGRTIGMTGDVVWTSASFDGSGNVTGAATIQANAVESAMIAENNITSRELAANTIATGNIADNAVDGTKIAQNSILTRHIDDSQVDTAQLAADAVTGAKIADDAIDSEHYTDGSIDTAHIADDQVTAAKLANTAVTAAAYGSSSAIPVITVDAQGRITAATTAATSSTLTIAADSGSNDTVTVGTDTLTFAGTSNEINTTVSNNQITIGLPDDVTIAGDLTVSGDTTTVNTATLSVEDPLIILASGNNSADAVDIGLYGLYDTSGSQDLYAGLFRDASDSGKWKLFKDNQAAPTTTVNTSGTGYATGTLVANLEGNVTGNVTGNTSGTAATVTTAAQTNITSLGTLTALTVDNVVIDGAVIGHTGDTDLITLSSGVVTVAGEVDATSLDISGDADIDGTLEADAITVDGTTLAEYIADTAGAMFSSNTETGITATYQDGDNTVDLVVGTLNQDTTGTAAIATSVTASANNSTDETVYPTFIDGATGTQGIETDTGLTYNPSSGILTATQFTGNVTGNVTGNTSGTAATVTTAAQTNITSLGTLTALTVDDVAIDGKVVTMTGSSGDTATVTVGTNGTLDITTVDTAAAAANMTLTADGTFEAVGTTITLDSGGAINLEPASGSAILLDGTISVDAGVVTGATSITSTAFVGDITGDVTGTADLATSVTVSANNSTDETVYPVFVDGATGTQGAETDTGFTYNPSSGLLTIAGELDAGSLDISGNVDIDGVLETDNLTIGGAQGSDGQVLTSTGSGVGWEDAAGGGIAPSLNSMTGDGSDTTLALSTTPANENATIVTLNGVVQHKDTYAVSGSTLTFDAAPANGVKVECIVINTTSVSTATVLQDADSDTKIQVEESSDEDTIRFDIAGTEQITLADGVLKPTTDSDVDFGSTSLRWKDAFVDSITVTGEVDGASLDISGNADIDGTLEADAITVDGTALNEYIADTIGAMVGSNTESGITVAYQDGDNTLDFTVGTLNQDTTGTAAIATTVTITDNESTNENNAIIFTAGGDLDGGNLGLESDGTLHYNPSTGLVTATGFSGNLTGTLQTASQTNITSVGTIGTGVWQGTAIASAYIANNAILTQHIDDNQVTTDQIAANTIATGNIADNAVDSTKIAQNSILTRHIDDGQVDTAQLAADAVDGTKIADDAIDSEHYTDGSIDTAHIANNAILTQHIDDNQVTTDQIAANTIATGNIADNAVDSTKIASNSILTRHIDDDQVTGDQLADAITVVTSVTSPKVIATTSARTTQVAITSSSNAIAWDSTAAANAYHVTTENTTFSAPSNATEGAIIQVELAQGGTARTIAWNTVFEFAASTAPTVTATASKTDIFTFRYNGSVWQEIGRVQNLAQT